MLDALRMEDGSYLYTEKSLFERYSGAVNSGDYDKANLFRRLALKMYLGDEELLERMPDCKI